VIRPPAAGRRCGGRRRAGRMGGSAERVAMPTTDDDLAARIGASIPDGVRRRYDELAAKRRDETITADEHAELLRLIDEVERRQADRVAALAELARRRGVSLTAVMNQLGIRMETT
jgi:hypothetical protein